MTIIGITVTKRQAELLSLIISEYINTAFPISSKVLERSGFFGLSSATIRSEMNNLEEDGFLAHIHTSSGRIPTDRAYRYFVDNLMNVQEPVTSGINKRKIRSALDTAGPNPRQINRTVAQLLSDLTENLVITNVTEETDFYKIGLSSLFEMPEFREFDKVFKLTSFFDEFEFVFAKMERDLFSMADRSNFKTASGNLRIFIGHENPLHDIHDETVMVAKYQLPNNLTGTLTMIGPTRMDYQKNIGLIRFTTNELNRLASQT